jgi:RND family efflux transporter MFP subunit
VKPFFLVLFVLLLGCRKEATLKGLHPAITRVESTVTTISSGTVQAEQQAILGFGTTGRINRVYYKVGDIVKKGTKIAELENRDLAFAMQDAIKEAQRARELFQSHLVSQVAFDDARRAEQAARANYDRSVIVAPFDGLITEENLDLGAQVSPEAVKPPVRLIDQKPRLVKGDIDEVDLGKVNVGQLARVRIPAVRSQAFEAAVSQVVPFVDTTKEQDRTSQIELRMKQNDVAIPVGASAEIEIVTAHKDDALAVPARLVLGSGAERYVYRYADGRIRKTPVVLGIGNYDRLEIASGISPSDTVVYPADDVEMTDGLKAKIEPVKWP